MPLDNYKGPSLAGVKVVGFALDNQSAVLTVCALPIMVLPLHIIDAARRGNSRVVMAWLDTAPQGSVNDEGQFPHGPFMLDPGTLLSWTCLTHGRACYTEGHVELARRLLARGADPNMRDSHHMTPLNYACRESNGAVVEMVSLLINAGTEFEYHRSVTTEDGTVYELEYETPLSSAMETYLKPNNADWCVFDPSPAGLKVIYMLLRAGASLDKLGMRLSEDSAENFLLRTHNSDRFTYKLEGDELQKWHRHFDALWALVAEVRVAGSWNKYVVAPRREFLAVRSLAVRGHLATSDPVLDFLVRADNGVLWNVLSYWDGTEGYSRPPSRPQRLRAAASSFFRRVAGFFTGRS